MGKLLLACTLLRTTLEALLLANIKSPRKKPSWSGKILEESGSKKLFEYVVVGSGISNDVVARTPTELLSRFPALFNVSEELTMEETLPTEREISVPVERSLDVVSVTADAAELLRSVEATVEMP